MVANLGLAGTKAVAGIYGNSAALVADAGHSLADLLSDVITLGAVIVSRIPADSAHAYGYGKYEALGTLAVGVLVAVTGIGIGVHSYEVIALHVDGEPLVHSLSSAATTTAAAVTTAAAAVTTEGGGPLAPVAPSSLALGAALVSLVVKETLFRATKRVGERIRSSVVVANAWHHRSDALSSLVAFGGVAGARAGLPLLDPVAGLAVSVMVVRAGIELLGPALAELTDSAVASDRVDMLAAVAAAVPGVVGVEDCRAVKRGPNVSVDLTIRVVDTTSVSAAHQTAEWVRWSVMGRNEDVHEVLVHVVPTSWTATPGTASSCTAAPPPASTSSSSPTGAAAATATAATAAAISSTALSPSSLQEHASAPEDGGEGGATRGREVANTEEALRRRSMRHLFETFDLDGCGTITRYEIEEFLRTRLTLDGPAPTESVVPDRAVEMFLDACFPSSHPGGAIDFNEFYEAVQSNPRVAALLLRTPAVIEEDVRRIIQECVPAIRDVSHVVVHFGVGGARVDIQIIVDETLTVEKVRSRDGAVTRDVQKKEVY